METLKNRFAPVRTLPVETFEASHTLRQLVQLLLFLKIHGQSTYINCGALIIVRRVTETHDYFIMSPLFLFTFTVLCTVHCYPSEVRTNPPFPSLDNSMIVMCF